MVVVCATSELDVRRRRHTADRVRLDTTGGLSAAAIGVGATEFVSSWPIGQRRRPTLSPIEWAAETRLHSSDSLKTEST